ncbi:D(2)-like dopamine receptor [Stylophora pistillata]|uniref:D(2)-like dopamine receptor n=1 Tax=Stylophora pistillata TaxID=50429 RepID=UPI000C03C23F|nr:D(2)-like dopamine receptor [Stylophora pistillata]
MENSTIFHDCSQQSFTVSTSALITILSLSGVCGIAAILLNILVILVMFYKPALRSMTNYWIVSLAVADLLIATLGVPVWCLKLLQKTRFIEEKVHNVFSVIVVLTLSASSLNHLALSYDRYIGVTAPFQYRSRLTPRKCGKIIAVIWTLSLLLALISLKNNCSISGDGHFALFVAIFGIPLMFICYFYMRIFKEANRQKRLIKIQETCSNQYQPCFLKEYKAVMTVAMVTGSFVLCWLPCLIDSVIHLSAPKVWADTQLWLGTTTLACFSSVLNPILYSVRIKAFRSTFPITIIFPKVKRNSVSITPHTV